jgi:hypothetical protein
MALVLPSCLAPLSQITQLTFEKPARSLVAGTRPDAACSPKIRGTCIV